jgi:ABC-type dipeptide/oligopeptide/nickel transport system permease subunit
VLAAFSLLAAAAPLVAPYDPHAQVAPPFAPPSRHHVLGANDVGQELFSELVYGSRISLVIGGVSWARPARELRALVLSVRERDYVQAARAMGGTDGRIMIRHVLPGVAPLSVPQFVRAAQAAILLEASLSFLGLGDPGAKSWGTILFYANARGAFLTHAWLWWVLPTGLCISAVVIGFAFVGYALEERLAPGLRTLTARAEPDRLWRGPRSQCAQGNGVLPTIATPSPRPRRSSTISFSRYPEATTRARCPRLRGISGRSRSGAAAGCSRSRSIG